MRRLALSSQPLWFEPLRTGKRVSSSVRAIASPRSIFVSLCSGRFVRSVAGTSARSEFNMAAEPVFWSKDFGQSNNFYMMRGLGGYTKKDEYFYEKHSFKRDRQYNFPDLFWMMSNFKEDIVNHREYFDVQDIVKHIHHFKKEMLMVFVHLFNGWADRTFYEATGQTNFEQHFDHFNNFAYKQKGGGKGIGGKRPSRWQLSTTTSSTRAPWSTTSPVPAVNTIFQQKPREDTSEATGWSTSAPPWRRPSTCMPQSAKAGTDMPNTHFGHNEKNHFLKIE